MITLVAAMGKNREIGKNNDLLWKIPMDLKRFKLLTLNKTIIMGRKTFESLPGLLPNREHVVITRDKNYIAKGCTVVNSLEAAINASGHNPYIIGGGEIYKQALPIADCIELTLVDKDFEADTFFPKINEKKWELYKENHFEASGYDIYFKTFFRIKK